LIPARIPNAEPGGESGQRPSLLEDEMEELRVIQIIWVPDSTVCQGALYGVGADGRVYHFNGNHWCPLSMKIGRHRENKAMTGVDVFESAGLPREHQR
jgi:hypothetical protein